MHIEVENKEAPNQDDDESSAYFRRFIETLESNSVMQSGTGQNFAFDNGDFKFLQKEKPAYKKYDDKAFTNDLKSFKYGEDFYHRDEIDVK